MDSRWTILAGVDAAWPVAGTTSPILMCLLLLILGVQCAAKLSLSMQERRTKMLHGRVYSAQNDEGGPLVYAMESGGPLGSQINIRRQLAAIVRGYTAAQKDEISVPSIGMSASISISSPLSVYQPASTLCNSMVSRWETMVTRIRS
jgi:hypothetical protein